jgi:hypothetical protein
MHELVYPTDRCKPFIIQRIEAQKGAFVLEIPTRNVRPEVRHRLETMRQVTKIYEIGHLTIIAGNA